ncbi:Flavin-binding monooxygenase-like protein 1 [Elsinoe fawcettii]|nr:Flavin-binding monooxygenase-like protein 1 [Elsinoe fawcettii]
MVTAPEYDVLIIGGGLSGLYALHKAHKDGLRARVLEAGSGVGGTWFWNRYPGARFDSESYTYAFSFSKELLDEWSWSEHFAAQPETLRYIQYIVDRFDLKKDIQFNTRIKSAQYQPNSTWLLTDESGRTYTSRFFVPAMGILNSPTLPAIPGIPSFRGESYHTSRWPTTPVDLSNKRVAIIGTGATGIQVIQTIYKTVQYLVVFQRTANWTAPMNNAAITPQEMSDIRASYPEIFAKCDRTPTCFMHEPIMRRTVEVPPSEREEIWESLFRQRGFAKWAGAFADLMLDAEANKLYSDFVAKKIRARVHDPVTAEKLVPKDHGFGTRRVPLEMEYYDAFNQANVELVDLKSNPIETVHEKGIRTKEKDFEFDVIIFATGFDAITGSFDAVDIQGVDGLKLRDRWEENIVTYLGIAVKGFPNMLMSLGPHQALGNIPRTIEHNVGWIMDFVKWAHDKGIRRIEATEEGEKSWTGHVEDLYSKTLLSETNSWMTGINTNLKHRQKRRATVYMGHAVEYRKKATEVKEKGYEGFQLS